MSASVAEIGPVNIERLEDIKGPSGTLYGASLSTFGGLFNRVMKRPGDYFKGEVNYTAGTRGLNRLTVDINTPLNDAKTVPMRVIAAAHSERSFQDNGYFKTFTVAPAFTFKPAEKLTINVNGEFYKRQGTTAFANTVNYARVNARSAGQLKLDYNKSYGNNSLLAETQSHNFYAQASYKINDHWTSQTNLSYAAARFSYPAYYLNTLNDSLLSRGVRLQYTNQLSNQLQQNFIGEFSVGRMKNKVLVGVDVQYGRFDFPNTRDFAIDTLNCLKPGKKYAAFNVDDIEARVPGKPNVGSRSGNPV